MQGEAATKLEQIRSAVALPFHQFSGSSAGDMPSECRQPTACASVPVETDASAEQWEDIIQLEASPAEDPLPNEPPSSAPDLENGVGLRQWEPFDYAAGRKEVKFGDRREAREKGVGSGKVPGSDGSRTSESEFSAPRRCQAYPPSGNRSATFH